MSHLGILFKEEFTGWDDLLIKVENLGHITAVSIFDNHRLHIASHIRHIFKPKMFRHILNHFRLWYRRRRLHLQNISNDDLMNAALNKEMHL